MRWRGYLPAFPGYKQVLEFFGRDGKSSTGHDSYTMRFENTSPHAIRLESPNAPMFGAPVCIWCGSRSRPMRDQAVQTARQADVVVAFVGLSPSLEGEEMPANVGFHGGDRTRINLPQLQEVPLQAVAATGKPLVVVLMNGSALAVPWAKDHAAAILEAWYPGEEGGAAIAETLAGDDNPAGRLPVTFYASLEQLPPFEDYSMAGRTYRYFSGQPLYGFGYGLSYTTFTYSHLKLSSAEIQAGEPLTVEADVTNTGKRQGDEVVEIDLFVDLKPRARHYASCARLSGSIFQSERPGILPLRSIPRISSEVDHDGVRAVMAGRYAVFLGGGQPGQAPGADAQFSISGQQVVTP